MDAENDKINKIGNELNYYKYIKLLKEVYTEIVFSAYASFYNWPDRCPHKLADHLDEIPANQGHKKSLRKLLTAGEISKVQAMKKDKQKLRGYDITFYFKLTQFATNNGQLKPVNYYVWNKNCPEDRKDELEHLLFLIKDDKNNFNYKDDQFLKLKDMDIKSLCDTMHERLPSIIKQIGERIGEEQTVIDKSSNKFRDYIESIRVMKEISSFDETPVLMIMIQKDLMPKLEELRRCFRKELKSYCKPYFKIKNGKTISTEELLSNSNFQLICINAEAGHGKTSFTKYVQLKLLLKMHNEVDGDLASHEIPIRVVCRNITERDVSRFLEDEIPFSRHYASSMNKFLERFNICWIIDGYDEGTGEFSGFFQLLLKTLPSNHKIIITARPDSLNEIKDELKNMKVYDVSIECFADRQLKDVAEKYLGEDRVSDFISSIQTLNDDMKDFMKIPINLIICLELWTNNCCAFNGNLTTVYKSYDIVFEKLRNTLVERHKTKTHVTSEDDLKMHVMNWFGDLCAIFAESPFGYKLNISQSQIEKLMKSAQENFLLGSFCLSTFFNFENSSNGIKYFLKHKIQKEVLVCHYLKSCEYENLKMIVEQDDIRYLLIRKNPFSIFKFLMECCTSMEFSKIFALYFKIYPSLQRPSCLLQIKREKQDYFNALKKIFKDFGQLVLHVDKDDDSMDLMDVIQYLSPDVKAFKLVISLDYGSGGVHSKINEVLSKYKDCIKLKLMIIISQENVNNFDILLKHRKLIKEIDIKFSRQLSNRQRNYLYSQSLKDWYDIRRLNGMLKDIFSLTNLQKISIDIDGSRYLDTFLHHLATSPLLFLVSYMSCDAHFIIKKMENPPLVIKDLLIVARKFGSISVDFQLSDQYITCNTKTDLLTKFDSSDVLLKQLDIGLGYCCQTSFWMQLVNCKTIEALNVNLWQDDDSQSLKALKNLFEVLDFIKLSKLKEIEFEIATSDQLNILFDQLPTKHFDETAVKVRLDPDKWLSIVKNTISQDSIKNKFKKLEILKCEDCISLGKIDSKIIRYFKSLSKSLIIYGVPHSSHMSYITANEQKIKEVAVKYLGDIEVEDFLYWYRSMNEDSKQSVKIPILLKLYLLSVQEKRPLLKGNLTAINVFKNSIECIVELHSRDVRVISNKDELKIKVEKWFDHFCKVVARIMFTLEREFSKSDEDELMQSASDLDLIGSFCLSSFLNHTDLSTSKTNYLFKDDIQKEILAYFGLKMSGDSMIHEILKDSYSKSIVDFTFLLESGDFLLKRMILKDLMPKLQELKRYFREELKSYCKPYFEIENGTSISTEELLSNSNFQLICINAEAGHGKTSFTKFIQCKLLSEIEKAGDDDVGSWEIPVRIICRNIIGRDVSRFLEDEIPFSRLYASSTSNLKKFLERFPIVWIIDGYDERTAEFSKFFESLLKTLPNNYKIIVTSRRNSSKELKDKLKGKEVCEVSIKSFDDQQIREVAKDYLGEGKVTDFESAIKVLNDEMLKFIKIPINLSLCMELWSSDRTIFDGQLKSIYQLYDKMLENHRNLLVSRLKGMAYDSSEENLKHGVKLWFSYLCEVVAESAFSYDLRISEAQKTKLMKKAKSYGLIGTYCLSTFFYTDKSSVKTNYFIRHKTQKEVLSCIYLKECDNDALKAVAQQGGNYDLLNHEYRYRNCFEHFKFLMECCNVCEFARIFVPLLEIYSELQRPDCLLQIKDGNEKYFDDLKTHFKASGQSLVLHVYGVEFDKENADVSEYENDDDVSDLLKVFRYLMPDLNSFKLIIDWRITIHKEINDFISKYKYCNSFDLKLGFDEPNKFVRVIQMFSKEGNQNLIKELDLNYYYMYEWTEEMKKELFKLESLNFASFYVSCSKYSSSMLHHFATEEIDSKEESKKLDSIVTPPSQLSPEVHSPKTPSTTTNPLPSRTPSSTSLAAFDHSSHLHFDIMWIEDPSKVIKDILKVNSKFTSMSVDLDFSSESRELPDNLLRRFLSSSVQVKGLRIRLDASSEFPNVMKLVNYGHIETLELDSFNRDESSSVTDFESFLAICDFDKMNKIKEIDLVIYAKSPLKLIYNKLPSDLLIKTELYADLSKLSAEMEIVVAKQFKRIRINNSEYFSASEIDQLKSISKSFYNED